MTSGWLSVTCRWYVPSLTYSQNIKQDSYSLRKFTEQIIKDAFRPAPGFVWVLTITHIVCLCISGRMKHCWCIQSRKEHHLRLNPFEQFLPRVEAHPCWCRPADDCYEAEYPGDEAARGYINQAVIARAHSVISCSRLNNIMSQTSQSVTNE